MEQAIVRYYRLFNEQERSDGPFILLSLQNLLVSWGFLLANRYAAKSTKHAVLAYATNRLPDRRSIVTIHQFGDQAQPQVLSVVIGMHPESDPECLASIREALFQKAFQKEGIMTRHIEVLCQGGHELISPDSHPAEVMAALYPSPQAAPVSGTASRPTPRA